MTLATTTPPARNDFSRPATAGPTVTHMVVTPTKSVGIAILATLFLGPLGLFYASVRGAFILIALAIVAAAALLATGLSGNGGIGTLTGLGLLLPVTWIAAFVWGIVAVQAYNARLLASGR